MDSGGSTRLASEYDRLYRIAAATARTYIVHVDNKRSVRTTKKFEINEDGQTAYLEFETDSSGWMTIWHTEVPPALRGRGLATELRVPRLSMQGRIICESM